MGRHWQRRPALVLNDIPENQVSCQQTWFGASNSAPSNNSWLANVMTLVCAERQHKVNAIFFRPRQFITKVVSKHFVVNKELLHAISVSVRILPFSFIATSNNLTWPSKQGDFSPEQNTAYKCSVKLWTQYKMSNMDETEVDIFLEKCI